MKEKLSTYYLKRTCIFSSLLFLLAILSLDKSHSQITRLTPIASWPDSQPHEERKLLLEIFGSGTVDPTESTLWRGINNLASDCETLAEFPNRFSDASMLDERNNAIDLLRLVQADASMLEEYSNIDPAPYKILAANSVDLATSLAQLQYLEVDQAINNDLCSLLIRRGPIGLMRGPIRAAIGRID